MLDREKRDILNFKTYDNGARRYGDSVRRTGLGGSQKNLAGELVKRNTGHVEIFASVEQPFDRFADLKGRLAWDTSHPATTAEHRSDVFYIGIKPAALKMQGGSSTTHSCAAFRTGFTAYCFGFFRTWLFIHWSRWGTYVVTISTDWLARQSTTT